MTGREKKILLTGATGFVGKQLSSCLATDECDLRCATRKHLLGGNSVVVGDIGPETLWGEALNGIDTVIHTAAQVHSMKKENADPLTEYRKVNAKGTFNLARQAVNAGIKRFIFLSTIKVNGEVTFPDAPFTADNTPAPVDPYGISKMEAEEGLRRIAEDSDMDIVIIRSPLVYGPGVKGNFQSMMSWLQKGVPLPLGAIHNRRSLVALDNLVDLIITCIDHPAAANNVFLVGDGEDLSTTELLQRLGKALNKPARLLPVPAWLLKSGAAMIGKRAITQRLCGSLEVDISKARCILGWTPPVSVDEALQKTAKDYLHGLDQL